MMKNFASIFILMMIWQSACGQTATQPVEEPEAKPSQTVEKKDFVKVEQDKDSKYPALMPQAETMGRAYARFDVNKMVEFTHEKAIEKAGGKEKFVQLLNRFFKDPDIANLKIVSYEIKKPVQIVEDNKQVFAVLPTKMTAVVEGKNESAESFLFAISEDQGNSWKFIRTENKAMISDFFPNAAKKLNDF